MSQPCACDSGKGITCEYHEEIETEIVCEGARKILKAGMHRTKPRVPTDEELVAIVHRWERWDHGSWDTAATRGLVERMRLLAKDQRETNVNWEAWANGR